MTQFVTAKQGEPEKTQQHIYRRFHSQRALGVLGLALGFAFILAWGFGGVLSIRKSTSSSRVRAGVLVMLIGSWWSVIWSTWFNPKGLTKLSRNYTQFVVGGIAISWASIETALDSLVMVAYHSGGNDLAASLPRALNRKIQFMKLVFKKLPAFGPFKEEGGRFLDRIELLSNERHWAIHGTVLEHTANRDFEIVVSKASRFEHHLTYENRTMTISDLIEIWEKSNNLAIEMCGFSRPICRQFLNNNTDDTTGDGKV